MFAFIVLMAIVDGPNGQHTATYEGMAQETIVRLEQERGNTVRFVDQPTYDAFMASNTSRPTVDKTRELAKKSARQTLLRSTSTQTQKMNALILLFDLDK